MKWAIGEKMMWRFRDSHYRLVRVHADNGQGQSYPQISCARQQRSCWCRELEISNNVSQAGPFIPQRTSGGSIAQGWGSYPFTPRAPAALTEVLPRLVPELLMVFWTECILGTERKREGRRLGKMFLLSLLTFRNTNCWEHAVHCGTGFLPFSLHLFFSGD